MGYDMTIVQERDQAEQDATAAARAHINTLTRPFDAPDGEERDAAQATWNAAWKALDRANRSYFRLNIWGMSRCRYLMDALGMLTGEDAPSFPRLEHYGLTEYPDDPEDYEGEERKAAEAKLGPAGRRFLDDCQAVTDYEPQPVKGIPVGKFGSNDGWLVTPAQCEAALAQWKAQPLAAQRKAEATDEWWPSWIAFLTYAKDRGGFRVH